MGIHEQEIRGNFIAGAWRASSEATTNINPSDLDETVGLYAPSYD